MRRSAAKRKPFEMDRLATRQCGYRVGQAPMVNSCHLPRSLTPTALSYGAASIRPFSASALSRAFIGLVSTVTLRDAASAARLGLGNDGLYYRCAEIDARAGGLVGRESHRRHSR